MKSKNMISVNELILLAHMTTESGFRQTLSNLKLEYYMESLMQEHITRFKIQSYSPEIEIIFEHDICVTDPI